mgnify:CR=1 FL=1
MQPDLYICHPVKQDLQISDLVTIHYFEYGKDYQYAHNTEEKLTAMTCLPDSIAKTGRRYYEPTTQGREKLVKERLQQIEEWKKSRR